MSWTSYIAGYENYLILEKGLADNSISSYLSDVNRFHKFFSYVVSPKLAVDNINYHHLQNFLAWLHDMELGVRSQARMISSLKSFYGYLELEDIIRENPTVLLESPKLPKKIPDTLSVDEVDLIINSVDRGAPEGERNVAILEVLYGCGLRVSELINLKISEIYWEESFIRVIGKGDKQRIIPFGSNMRKHIEIYIEHIRNFIKIKPGHEDFLFLNRRGAQLSRVMIFNIVKSTVRNAQIDKNVSPHTFRHSFATHLIENGADLRAVQEMLGHVSITTTEIYTHLDNSYLRDVLESHHPLHKMI